ncbi:MAG: right-handed parallel beta-helix repeat-containing protein [Actinomycetota bacterium]|nr:right-handed parallel beta-helix repeat-containing protein [Actinomycetota bacterium]
MRRALAVAVLVVLAGGSYLVGRPPTIDVPPGPSLQAAVDRAPDGAVIRLGAGSHEGGVVISRPMSLEGPGATLITPAHTEVGLSIRADDVSVTDLTVSGGMDGISVREADQVEISGVTVRGTELHGIEVVDASARISDASVEAPAGAYAQGIEVRYADNHAPTVVERSHVVGGQEGIVAHVARVRFDDNLVSDTKLRAIAITEMSHGSAQGNRITGATGAGLFCGDWSRCAFSDNQVATVGPLFSRGSAAGWGLAVSYHSSASSDDDLLSGAAGPRATFVGSLIKARSPLELGDGLAALPAVAAAAGIALVLLLAAVVTMRAVADRPASRERKPSARTRRVALAAIGAALAIQTFHMAEHALQTFRVRVDGVPSRGGFAGPIVEPEWIHFFYNAVVFGGLIVMALWSKRFDPTNLVATGRRFAAGAALIQAYHVVEHSAKLLQHLGTGRKVNPGLLGGEIDLVLLHFGLNLAVYAGFVVAGAYLVWLLRGMGPARRAVPVPTRAQVT